MIRRNLRHLLSQEDRLLTATLSKAEAIDLLRQDVAAAERTVNDLVTVPISQNKFDALVSLVYNIGRSKFDNSELLGAINAKASSATIRQEWSEWRMAGGRVLRGLELRRTDELALYFQ